MNSPEHESARPARAHLRLITEDSTARQRTMAIVADGIVDCVRQIKEMFYDQTPGSEADFWRVVDGLSYDLYSGLRIYRLLMAAEERERGAQEQ